jgi:hypothetical protein
MAIYLGADALGGGGGKVPTDTYAVLNGQVDDHVTTDDGSIWLKTGVVYTSDGSGSVTDADIYPDASRTPSLTDTTVTRSSGELPCGYYTQWWKNEVLFLSSTTAARKFNTDSTLSEDTSFNAGVMAAGGWAPAFYVGTKQYSIQARAGFKVGQNDWTFGQGIFEVTGDWPNYTAVGSAINTNLDNHLASTQDWDGLHGWAANDNRLVIATEDGIYNWSNWKTSASSTSTRTVPGNGWLVQQDSDYYWHGSRIVGSEQTAQQRRLSDNSLTGKTLKYITANISTDIGAPLISLDQTGNNWYAVTTAGTTNNVLTKYSDTVGSQYAKYSRGFTDNVASTVNGVASVGLPRVVQNQLYVKIGNTTT